MTNERPMPADPTRRRLLTVTAGAAVAAMATARVAGSAADPIYAAAAAVSAAEPDPIFVAIEKHQAAIVAWDAKVAVRAEFPDGPINDAWRAARSALDDAGVDLINTAPKTLRGISRALNYIREQLVQEHGTYMPSGLVLKDEDSPENEICESGWVDAFLDTIEYAADELDRAGKAVQS
jgi:hypothetical protein